jgi:hypothetical protein
MNEILTDFPKLECPFLRQTFKVNPDHWRKTGRALQLRSPEAYLVVNRVNPGYEWVFEDEETFATEKLNGTNVKMKIEDGRLVALQNRKNVLDPLQILSGKIFIIEGVFAAIAKGYVQDNAEQAGEVIGPKLQGNPYKLDSHIWYPFNKAIDHLRYKSFLEHDRTFDNWSGWFKDYLFSLFASKMTKKGETKEKIFAEGVVFYNLRRKAEGKTWMAKLRRDMFDWFYEGIEIFDYNPAGRDEEENQEKFD